MIEDAAKPGHPAIRSVIVDKNGRLTNDLTCPRCRYNLRGVQQDGVCPECGLAVEKAILASNDPRWTKLQIVLSILAFAYGVVLPIVNFVASQYEYNISTMLVPEQVFTGFVVLWLLGGLAWFIMLAIAASNRIYTRTFLLIMAAVLAETVIAVGMIAVWWGRHTSV